jgi:hypothetical protein
VEVTLIVARVLLVKGMDFTDQGGKMKIGVPVVGGEGANFFYLYGIGRTGIEPGSTRHEQAVCVPDQKTLDRGPTVIGDAEGALTEGTQAAGPASRPFGENEDIAPGSEIFLDAFDIPEDERFILTPVVRGNVAGAAQQSAENRHLEKVFLTMVFCFSKSEMRRRGSR